MVYCDKCGTRLHRHDRYCRICGRTVNRPPRLWRARQAIAARHEPTLGESAVLEKASTTNRKIPTDLTRGAALEPRPVLPEVETKPVREPIREERSDRMPDEALAKKIQELEKEKESLRREVWKTRKRPSTIAGYGMAAIGAVSLLSSVIFASTVLAFIGLGLAFWGVLLLFIRPRKYVRSELMDSTALSSLRTIDRLITSLGYSQKGIYIPAPNPEKTVVFVPSAPLKRIPRAEEIEKETFSKTPDGVTMVPPGIALANLFERELGVEFSKCTLETLRERLPKLLIEDLEMVQDFAMDVNGNSVRLKFTESIYEDFCRNLKTSTSVCSSLGCPICSAMACVLAQATGKPVGFHEDTFSPDGRTVESEYRILEW